MRNILCAFIVAACVGVTMQWSAKADAYDDVIAQCPAMKGRETREIANQNVQANGGVARVVAGFKAMGWCDPVKTSPKVKSIPNRRRTS